jgi:hypothetical protein
VHEGCGSQTGDEAKLGIAGRETVRLFRPNWLLHLLASVDGETKACILLLLWRAWYLRNDAVHAKGEGSIAGSAGFLASYALALHIAKDAEGPATDTKR